MKSKTTQRHYENQKAGYARRTNKDHYAVDYNNGTTKYYDNNGYQTGSQGVDKTSPAFRMCGELDD